MLPELFRIPGLDIPLSTYGLLLAIAFISALWLIARLASRDGLNKQRVFDLGLYILASALIGAKVLMVIVEWKEYGGDWSRVFSFDLLRSGGVYYGGFLIAVAVSVFLMRRWRLPWRKTADAFAPGIALGHTIGRLGCFSAGCCWGKPTTSWIGVKFTAKANELTSVPIHIELVPTQLIEAGANLLIFIALLLLRKRRAFDGQIILAYLMLYSIARFTIEFWRGDPRGELLGLSTSQVISILLFPLALALTIYYWRRRRVQDAGGRMQDTGSRMEDAGTRMQETGSGRQDANS
ncbi:MAG TPA: prolipoprotein diacylglyceryl transferase [Blastocatellia bacterium]|nr:prolipoprotein diacylglyceryl transferase [Blastocatellia bacterium]